jgi:hypothetical protein
MLFGINFAQWERQERNIEAHNKLQLLEEESKNATKQNQ